ncbi:unnamed protein product [Cuscuta campestris]|uniref:Phospholipid/glycerol acyltransferase domain-containing protein n=1 Tax=Cuscuta campestris TaxID=132261 RepID=A0A484NFF5_9ASTE|nr:unnamed protein product [Cuscuta campestris]
MTSDTIAVPKPIGPNEPDPQEKYAPYVRHDSYGIMGRAPLPWTEKVLLGVAMLTLLPLRVAAATTLVVLCYLTCRICTAFLGPNEHGNYAHLEGWRRKVIMASGRFTGRALLFAFGFYWIDETHRCHHHLPPLKSNHKAGSEEERAGVIVSNHVSYTDVLYHMSSSCASFVAKKSVARLPLVGLISKCLGCIYVERESKTPDLIGVSGVVNQRIQEAYKNKFSPMVILFPGQTNSCKFFSHEI